ncbi:coiled-coil domain-containing protein 103-like [Patiria miniata]|uniref:Coiled-coil domain-containing protein 103 n=1 Tax=Patiria miniata TaxID=46514 RepID=A0A914B5A9_PATMI|nr:coiled-coil domain-containing protein 103-like [Patiria miniata]XP_038071429.1 coiled-coil domain-containing protein 103-like [Patiria miniata]XP_038071430.1 coiled-coil domain-containing protein 103-like [Patiria miniata]XP_038071431.1 coiled-coil domain-containing protein 103-like [Patiria miniata]XP_038071432.1 coiled-coil domain-containing protein 103-like [Patiria miniata]
MADLKEDWIDFGKLEKELDAAVEKDARYWRENDAKFRAVDQRVETYEQFRDIVKAAHIKPLDKKDKIGEGKRNQPWNPYTSKTAGAEPPKSEDFSRKESSSLPKTSHEFTRDWKSRCKTPSEKYHLLMSLGGEQLGHIFRAEIGFGLLGDFVTVMNKEFQGSNLHCIVGILGSLARANRFGLSVDFLSKTERQECVELFQKLQQASEVQEESSATANVPSDSRAEEVPSETAVSAEHQLHQTFNEGTDTVQEKLTSLREVYKL